jgi:hypothetical protein
LFALGNRTSPAIFIVTLKRRVSCCISITFYPWISNRRNMGKMMRMLFILLRETRTTKGN